MLMKVKKEYLKRLDDVELSTYVATMLLCFKGKSSYIHNNAIMYLLYGDMKHGQQIRRRHTSALSSLIKEGFLRGCQCDKNSYIVDMPEVSKNDYYVGLTLDNIMPILLCNNKNKLTLIKIFLIVLGCRDKYSNYKVCDVSVSLLCKESGKSYSTVQRALDALVNIGALYKVTVCAHRANVYGLASDSNYIDKYAQNSAKRLNPSVTSAPKQPATSESKRAVATMDDFEEIFGPMDALDKWNEFRKAGKSPTVEELRKYEEINISV